MNRLADLIKVIKKAAWASLNLRGIPQTSDKQPRHTQAKSYFGRLPEQGAKVRPEHHIVHHEGPVGGGGATFQPYSVPPSTSHEGHLLTIVKPTRSH